MLDSPTPGMAADPGGGYEGHGIRTTPMHRLLLLALLLTGCDLFGPEEMFAGPPRRV